MPATELDYKALARQIVAEAMAGQNGRTLKTVPSSTPTHGIGHGVNGLFAFPGLEQDVVNAMVMPRLGLLDILPSRTSTSDNPMYGIMTGVTASTGSEPSGVCDDPPYAGLMKLCMHQFLWGRIARETRVMDIDVAGHYRNRSDFNDLQLVGNPLGGPDFYLPTVAGADPNQALRSEISKILFELAVAFGRDFAKLVYTGNPTNNTAGGGYKEPYGLDILINTGYRDAESGTACPAADSYVYNFNAKVEDNGAALVARIDNIYRNLNYIADRAGLNPATWAIVMPWGLFDAITAIWPCAYLTSGCGTGSASTPDWVNSADQIAMRDEMRNGEYLKIRGKNVPVILDDGISETDAGGTFTASIYFVPLRVLGNRPVTFLEYFNMDTPGGPMDAARALAPDGSYFTTNNGRYLWHKKPPTNFCVQILAKSYWRIILETPHIAARMTNVKWTPLQHTRSWDPTVATYYVNGGGTSRTGDKSYYTPTA